MFRLTIHAINKLIVVHFRSILHGDGDQTTSTGFIWCVLLYNMKSIWSTVRKQIMHFNVCYFLKASKHQKTHLEEPLAMLVENSFEVKSCCSHARHNFSRFSRPRLRHFKFRCCCEQIISRLLDPELLVHFLLACELAKNITSILFPEYSEVLRRIHDNHRTDVAEKTGDGGCALHLF